MTKASDKRKGKKLAHKLKKSGGITKEQASILKVKYGLSDKDIEQA